MKKPSSRSRARLTLLALAAVVAIGLLPTSREPARRVPSPGRGDAVLHLSTIERIRAGDDYYTAVGTELRRLHYPTTKVFNWRTPAHFELVAALSLPVARFMLRAMTLAALALLPLALRRESVAVRVVGFAALVGALATAVKPQAVVAGEVWAGVLITFSLLACHRAAWKSAALLGVAGVFMRELAAPYCAACAVTALKSRRRGETTLWVLGGIAYLAYFGVHATQVWAHQEPGDLSQDEPWTRWNGLAFSAATVAVNGWLAPAPHWATILYIAVALAGAAWSRMPGQVKVSVWTYFLLFAFVGQPFNYYWGYVTAPLWAFSVGHGAPAVWDLAKTATGRTPDPRDRT